MDITLEYLDKFQSIDLNKVSGEVKQEIKEIYDHTENLSDPDLVEVFKENFDLLYSLIEKQFPEAIEERVRRDVKPAKKKTAKKSVAESKVKVKTVAQDVSPNHENKYSRGSSLITPDGKNIEVYAYMWDSYKKSWIYYANASDERNEVFYLESELKPAPKAKPIEKAKKESTLAIKKIESYQDDLKLMRRFYAFSNKEKSFQQVLSLYKALKRAITERKVNKQSKYGSIVEEIQIKVNNLYNAMVKENLKVVRVEVTDTIFIEKVKSIIEQYSIFPSIRLIKRFITLEGAKPPIEKATRLAQDIDKSIKKGTVKKSDKYLPDVKNIHHVLQSYISKKKATIDLEPAKLNGLMGIPGILADQDFETEMNDGYNSGFTSGLKGLMSAKDLANRDMKVMEFRGKWAELMGKPAKNFDMMLHGQPGGGKTTFLLQFAEYLALHFGTVAYVSSEEYDATTLTKKVNEILNPIPDNLKFASGIEEAARLTGFDFLILDSVNDLGLDVKKYKALRNANPEMGFIIILQTTKDGNFKGGKDWEHEVEIAAEVEAGEIKVYKNRYGVKGELNFFQ